MYSLIPKDLCKPKWYFIQASPSTPATLSELLSAGPKTRYSFLLHSSALHYYSATGWQHVQAGEGFQTPKKLTDFFSVAGSCCSQGGEGGSHRGYMWLPSSSLSSGHTQCSASSPSSAAIGESSLPSSPTTASPAKLRPRRDKPEHAELNIAAFELRLTDNLQQSPIELFAASDQPISEQTM